MGDQIYQQVLYYLSALWRRRWLALMVAFVVAAVGWGAVATMPDQYRSNARIYVDTSTVLRPLLRGMTVDSNTNQQLEVMRRSLLTRPNLEKVARMTDLDLRATSPTEQSRLLDRIKANTRISMSRSNIFEVAYTAQDAQTAKAVVDALTTIFVEQNIGRDRADFQKAESFLQNQITDTQEQLNEVAAKIDSTRQDLGRLIPGTSNDYGAKVASLSNRVDDLQDKLDAARTKRETLQQELARTPSQTGGGAPGQTALQRSIAAVEGKLAELKLRYTDKHPDVQAAQRRLEKLRTKQEAGGQSGGDASTQPSGGESGGNASSNPVYSQLQVSLVEQRSEVQILERRLEATQKVLAELKSKRDQIREIEGRLSELRSERELLASRVKQMRQRLQSAELSSERQAQGDAVTFRMIEPPVAPQQPAAPNRALLATGILVVALGAGAGAAWFFALIKTSYGSVQRLKQDFSIPVVGHLSRVDGRRDLVRRQLDRVAFGGAGLCLLGLYGGLMVIERQMGLHAFVAQRLGGGSAVNLIETLRGAL